MPNLGIGNSTPFAMGSNHPTAFNHSFRDTSGYDTCLQTKVKCAFCGCWRTKGGQACYLCRRDPSGKNVVLNRADIAMGAEGRTPPPSAVHDRYTSLSTSGLVANTDDTTDRSIHPAVKGGRQPEEVHPSYIHSRQHRQRLLRQHERSHHGEHLRDDSGKFQDTSYEATCCNARVKCSYCGCWTKTGAPCSLCHTVNRKIAAPKQVVVVGQVQRDLLDALKRKKKNNKTSANPQQAGDVELLDRRHYQNSNSTSSAGRPGSAPVGAVSGAAVVVSPMTTGGGRAEVRGVTGRVVLPSRR